MLDLYSYSELNAATAGNYIPSPHGFLDRADARVLRAEPDVRQEITVTSSNLMPWRVYQTLVRLFMNGGAPIAISRTELYQIPLIRRKNGARNRVRK